MKNKKWLLVAIVVIVPMLLWLFVFNKKRADLPTKVPPRQTPEVPIVAPKPKSEQKPPPAVTEFDKKKYSLTDPESIWVIVNKKRALPNGFVPSDLIVPSVRLRLAASEQQMKFRKVAHADLVAMFNDAKKAGINLVFGSGYRSYALQKQFYDGYVARDGQAAADRYSARPGTSEHQSGLSFDATRTDGKCHLEECFATTAEGKWLSANAYKYGFTLRYKDGKEAVTGYQYEPWHYRYVGRELAAELNKTNQTLEEFFGIN